MSVVTARTLIQSFGNLLRAWWRVDRIRASPCGGRLLRLHPPCFVEIGGRTFEVTHRLVGQDAAGPFVVYDCCDKGDSAKLFVQFLSESSRTWIRWAGPDGERSLGEYDISVFERRDEMRPAVTL